MTNAITATASPKARASKAKADKATAPKGVFRVAKAAQDAVYIARGGFVSAKGKAYGATAAYADALTAKWGMNWHKIPMSGPVSDNSAAIRKEIREEKATLKALCESRKLSNIYKPWSDVLKYMSRDEAKREKATSTPASRLKTDAVALYKFLSKNYDDLNDKAKEAYDLIGEAIKIMDPKVNLADFHA